MLYDDEVFGTFDLAVTFEYFSSCGEPASSDYRRVTNIFRWTSRHVCLAALSRAEGPVDRENGWRLQPENAAGKTSLMSHNSYNQSHKPNHLVMWQLFGEILDLSRNRLPGC